MASLIENNAYLRNPEARKRMLEEDARQSSLFEGATGLKPVVSPLNEGKRRVIVSTKKAVKSP